MANHFELRLTSAGRAELTDNTNLGLSNVQLRRMAAGSGSGPGTQADADPRVALRSQEAIVALEGNAQPDSGRIGAVATFDALMAGDPDVEIRELGIFARVGDAGAEFLLAYGARPAAAAALTALTASGRTLITGVLDISSSDADVAITVAASITFEGLDSATDVETAAGAIRNKAVTPGGFAFGLQAAGRKATAARRGTMFAATTQAHATDANNVDRAITPKALNAVLGLITVLHFTQSNPNYVWNLPFSRALVIAKAGDGGGGAASASNQLGRETVAENGADTAVSDGTTTITATGGLGGLRGVPHLNHKKGIIYQG